VLVRDALRHGRRSRRRRSRDCGMGGAKADTPGDGLVRPVTAQRMPVEIERKFLILVAPEESPTTSARIRQGYLAAGADGEVRLRDSDGSFTLTVKSGEGVARGEAEIPLTVEQFERLWPATGGRRVEKRRTRVPLGDLVAEVDTYEGRLGGLVVVEVEFASLDEARAFVPPEWCGREVTCDAAYKNASLALRGRP